MGPLGGEPIRLPTPTSVTFGGGRRITWEDMQIAYNGVWSSRPPQGGVLTWGEALERAEEMRARSTSAGGVMDVRTRLDIEMNATTKAKVKDFFKKTLVQNVSATWPLRGVLLYLNGRAKEVMPGGYWQDDGQSKVFIGHVSEDGRQEQMRPHERLAICAALINICGLGEDEEVLGWFSQATGKCLVNMYGNIVKPLVEPKSGQGQVKEMAFSATGIAAKVNGAWVDYRGQAVDVTGSEWTRVEVVA